jgi:hypothetical protein
MLLRRVDERIGLTGAVAAVLDGRRAAARIMHGLREPVAQRIYGLCCGYEDLNDRTRLRDDLLMQTALGTVAPLASAPTLCRLEHAATTAPAWAVHGVLIRQFSASHAAAMACRLMQRLRALALKGTELQSAAAHTIRVKLLKIGAAIVRNTRRVRVLLASHHPLRELFVRAAQALVP